MLNRSRMTTLAAVSAGALAAGLLTLAPGQAQATDDEAPAVTRSEPVAKKNKKKDQRLTLTILHNNDGESSLLPSVVEGREYGGIARFITKVDQQRKRAGNTTRDSGETKRRAALVLNSGDNFLAGLTREASKSAGIDYDARAVRQVGYDALGIGNHEFDFGPQTFAGFAREVQRPGAMLPLLSANLKFGREPATADLDQLLPSTVFRRARQRIGVIGLTTPLLAQVSSPGSIGIGNRLAAIVQAQVDRMTGNGVNKIILVSHLQGLDAELELVESLSGVDVVIGGGGDEILASPGDALVPGDEEEIFGAYPQLANDADGTSVPVVTTPGNYRYVGVLQITFDKNGDITKIDDGDSGLGVVGARVPVSPLAKRSIEKPVAAARADLEAQVVADTEVVLDNSRAVKRVREANLGNLLADAHLASAVEQANDLGLSEPQVFFMNGGGIRGEDLDVPVGDITVADTFSIQPFGNFLSVAEDVPHQTIRDIIENGVDDGVGSQDGGFIQVSEGTELLIDSDGTVEDLELADGTLVVQAGVTVPGSSTISQLNFSAGGGDGQPDLGEVAGVTLTQTPVGDQVSFRDFLEDLGTVTDAGYPRDGEGRILFVTPGGPSQDPPMS